MEILNLLLVVGLTFVLLGVGLGVGATVNQQVQSTICAGDAGDITADCSNSTAGGAVANATIGIANLASWMPTIGTVSAAVVIIGLLLVGFGSFMGRGSESGV